ncbi:SDR family oxidoreductase [Candidatus Dojkabacteria bacterium]|uniref:SDR family oxidoreductase n=1 Tax=Candidatus Dojkabacteria bacterium TaxID=2099670 RepID=A0A3M0YZV1_9BACT|nr:MAG: SDR family oxidoreductase [Candidatus Dojkabacteria bacterium]
MKTLKDKKILITGGTSGLGFSLAKKFIQRGSVVYVTGKDESKLQEIKEKLKTENLVTLFCDITNLNDIKGMFKKIESLDVLVNNAAVWLEGELCENTDEEIKRTIDTNLTGLILTTKYSLSLLEESDEIGIIVNISSTAGIEPKHLNSVYSATKYAVRGFSECINLDYRYKNVRSICVFPGGIKTSFFHKAGVEKNVENYMDPDNVADCIVEILTKPNDMIVDSLVIRRTKY